MNDEQQGQLYLDREWEAEKLKAERDHVHRQQEGARLYELSLERAKHGIDFRLAVFFFIMSFMGGLFGGITVGHAFARESLVPEIESLEYRLSACNVVERERK